MPDFGSDILVCCTMCGLLLGINVCTFLVKTPSDSVSNVYLNTFIVTQEISNIISSRPNKPKNGGITAGISRAGPARDSLIDNGSDSGPEVSQLIYLLIYHLNYLP